MQCNAKCSATPLARMNCDLGELGFGGCGENLKDRIGRGSLPVALL